MSEAVLIELRPRRAGDAVQVPHRFAFRVPRNTTIDGLYYQPKVISLPSWRQDIGFDGAKFGGLALPQVGALEVAAEAVDFSLMWRGAACTIRRAPLVNGVVGAWGAPEKYRVQRIGRAGGLASIQLMDTGALLNGVVADRLFGSTGVAVLDDPINVDLIGKRVPTGWGRLFNIPGYLVDRANNIFLLLGRPSSAIHGIYDGGAAYAMGAARADLAALVANAPAEGAVDYAGAAGGLTLCRPWTTPAYLLTADITAQGAATAAGIGAAIVAARAPSLAFAAGAVAAFDALISATCGVYVDDERTIANALDFLFVGLGAWWKLNGAGEIELGRVDWAAPAKTFAAYEIEQIEREEMVFPAWATGVGYARLGKTHSEGEIATALLAGDISGLGDLATQDTVDWGAQVTGAGKPEDGATRRQWRGIHNSSLAYAKGDEVSNGANDRLYIAKSAVPAGVAVTNTAYWDLTLVAGGGAAGEAALSARLTNPTILVPTAADGSGGSYGGLTSQVEFYDGTERKDQLGLVAFSLVGAPAWASVSSTGLVTVGDWGATKAELKIDCTYAGFTLRVTLTLIRSLQGVQGPSITLAGGGAFEYVDGVATAGQTRTFTATLAGITGTVIWTTTPLGMPLTGAGNSRTLAVADMGANRQVTVRATISGLYDEDTAIRVDRSTAAAGATVGANELSKPEQEWEAAAWNPWSAAAIVANSTAGGWGAFVNPSGRCLRLYDTTDLARVAFTAELRPVRGPRAWLRVRAAWGLVSPAYGMRAVLYFYDEAGAYVSWVEFGRLTIGSAGVYTTTTLSAAIPAGAAKYQLRFEDTAQPAGGSWRIDIAQLSWSQPGADVTGENTAANTVMVGSALSSVLVADAATAKSNAAAALADLTVVASDSWLSRGEKPAVITEVQTITDEQPVLIARATALGLTGHTSYTTWAAALSALNAYLAGLSPAWNNPALDTAIAAATFRGRFSDYYYARGALTDLFVATVQATADSKTRNVDRGPWVSAALGTAYVVGDEVQDQGSTWGCILDHLKSAGNGPPTLPTASNSTWRLRSAKGDPGTPGQAGQSTAKIFARSISKPSTPANSAGVPAGYYADPDDVPPGVGSIWSHTGTKAVGAALWSWAGAVRDEAVSIVQGQQVVQITGLGATGWITLAIADGESVLVEAQWRANWSAGATANLGLEWQEYGSGTVTGLGTSDGPQTGGVGEPTFIEASGVLTNGGTAARQYQVRAVASKTGAGAASTVAADSFVRA